MGVRLVAVKKGWDKPVLRGLDLEIARGEIFALLGPSGCGKTTALRIVAGLETPDAGEVFVDGQSVASAAKSVPPERRQLGMVFQSYAVWPHMSVLENVAWPLRLRKFANADALAKAALERVRLSGFGDRWPNTLSGGQQQRVAIARALALRPKVLLLDEPLSNLDTGLREELREQVATLARSEGLTVVLVTHDQDEALSMCDRIGVICEGALLQVGTPHALYHRPQSRFVARFVGKLNVLPAHRARGRVNPGAIDVPGPDGPVEIGFRPESVVFADQGIACEVRSASYRGAFTRYRVMVGASEIIVDSATPPQPFLRVNDAWVLGD